MEQLVAAAVISGERAVIALSSAVFATTLKHLLRKHLGAVEAAVRRRRSSPRSVALPGRAPWRRVHRAALAGHGARAAIVRRLIDADGRSPPPAHIDS